MPSILDIYDTLLERGMPEHPRLKAPTHGNEGEEPESRLHLTGCQDDNTNWLDDQLGVWPHPDDARAILTMHALEWAKNLPAAGSPGMDTMIVDSPTTYTPPAGISRKTYKELQGEVARDWIEPKLLTWPIYDLDAILAATEHLEGT